MNKVDSKFLTKEIKIMKKINLVFKKEKRHFRLNSVRLYNLKRIYKTELFKLKESNGRVL